jgi:hypothetical protein
MSDAPRSDCPCVIMEDKLLDISDCMLWSPGKSVCKLPQQRRLSYDSAYLALRKHLQLHPYKITAVQELTTTDYTKCRTYCNWFNEFIVAHGEQIVDFLYYSDEAWICLSGYVSSQNTYIWTSVNLHALHEYPCTALKLQYDVLLQKIISLMKLWELRSACVKTRIPFLFWANGWGIRSQLLPTGWSHVTHFRRINERFATSL